MPTKKQKKRESSSLTRKKRTKSVSKSCTPTPVSTYGGKNKKLKSSFRAYNSNSSNHGNYNNSNATPTNNNISSIKSKINNYNSIGILIRVGYRYKLDDNRIGVCKYYGQTLFEPNGKWVGLIVEIGHGNNDGSVYGKRYFRCRENKGLFVRPSKIVLSLGSAKKHFDYPSIVVEQSPIATPPPTMVDNNIISKTPGVESGTNLKSRNFNDKRKSRTLTTSGSNLGVFNFEDPKSRRKASKSKKKNNKSTKNKSIIPKKRLSTPTSKTQLLVATPKSKTKTKSKNEFNFKLTELYYDENSDLSDSSASSYTYSDSSCDDSSDIDKKRNKHFDKKRQSSFAETLATTETIPGLLILSRRMEQIYNINDWKPPNWKLKPDYTNILEPKDTQVVNIMSYSQLVPHILSRRNTNSDHDINNNVSNPNKRHKKVNRKLGPVDIGKVKGYKSPQWSNDIKNNKDNKSFLDDKPNHITMTTIESIKNSDNIEKQFSYKNLKKKHKYNNSNNSVMFHKVIQLSQKQKDKEKELENNNSNNNNVKKLGPRDIGIVHGYKQPKYKDIINDNNDWMEEKLSWVPNKIKKRRIKYKNYKDNIKKHKNRDPKYLNKQNKLKSKKHKNSNSDKNSSSHLNVKSPKKLNFGRYRSSSYVEQLNLIHRKKLKSKKKDKDKQHLEVKPTLTNKSQSAPRNEKNKSHKSKNDKRKHKKNKTKHIKKSDSLTITTKKSLNDDSDLDEYSFHKAGPREIGRNTNYKIPNNKNLQKRLSNTSFLKAKTSVITRKKSKLSNNKLLISQSHTTETKELRELKEEENYDNNNNNKSSNKHYKLSFSKDSMPKLSFNNSSSNKSTKSNN